MCAFIQDLSLDHASGSLQIVFPPAPSFRNSPLLLFLACIPPHLCTEGQRVCVHSVSERRGGQHIASAVHPGESLRMVYMTCAKMIEFSPLLLKAGFDNLQYGPLKQRNTSDLAENVCGPSSAVAISTELQQARPMISYV